MLVKILTNFGAEYVVHDVNPGLAELRLIRNHWLRDGEKILSSTELEDNRGIYPLNGMRAWDVPLLGMYRITPHAQSFAAEYMGGYTVVKIPATTPERAAEIAMDNGWPVISNLADLRFSVCGTDWGDGEDLIYDKYEDANQVFEGLQRVHGETARMYVYLIDNDDSYTLLRS